MSSRAKGAWRTRWGCGCTRWGCGCVGAVDIEWELILLNTFKDVFPHSTSGPVIEGGHHQGARTLVRRGVGSWSGAYGK
jgi:hypothetical protein